MNCAAFIDLGAAKVSADALLQAERELDLRFDSVRFYGYNAKKNGDLNAYIKSRGAEVLLPLHNRKKTRVDIRQVIDAVAAACGVSSPQSLFLVCAEVDCAPLLAALRKMGKRVYIGSESGSSFADKCDGEIVLKKSVPTEVGAVPEIQDAASHGDELVKDGAEQEFLPYTGILPVDDERMRLLGDQIKKTVEEKRARKRAPKPDDEKDELKRLLDKYFG